MRLLTCGGLLRAFLWGAKSGKEQLPAFPEPSHRAAFACGIPNEAMTCMVGFTSRERRAAAHQMVATLLPVFLTMGNAWPDNLL